MYTAWGEVQSCLRVIPLSKKDRVNLHYGSSFCSWVCRNSARNILEYKKILDDWLMLMIEKQLNLIVSFVCGRGKLPYDSCL